MVHVSAVCRPYPHATHTSPNESAFPVPTATEHKSHDMQAGESPPIVFSDPPLSYLNVGFDVSTQALQLMGSNLHRHIISTGRLSLPYTQPHTNIQSAREPSKQTTHQHTHGANHRGGRTGGIGGESEQHAIANIQLLLLGHRPHVAQLAGADGFGGDIQVELVNQCLANRLQAETETHTHAHTHKTHEKLASPSCAERTVTPPPPKRTVKPLPPRATP